MCREQSNTRERITLDTVTEVMRSKLEQSASNSGEGRTRIVQQPFASLIHIAHFTR
jgi:hypothetical protein